MPRQYTGNKQILTDHKIESLSIDSHAAASSNPTVNFAGYNPIRYTESSQAKIESLDHVGEQRLPNAYFLSVIFVFRQGVQVSISQQYFAFIFLDFEQLS
jgi:hypothetical protein